MNLHSTISASAKICTRSPRASTRGFTLVELMVSMVASLFVTMAVIGVSNSATTTFNEEARTANAEMSVRAATDRLRNDLQRAGYMSTGNIRQDQRIPLTVGQPALSTAALAMPGFSRLAAIRFTPQGSAAATPISNTAANNYFPDSIDITGNMTTADSYVVRSIDGTGPNCGGQKLTLQTNSAAMWRVRASSTPGQVLKQAFQPAAGQFFVRVVDDANRVEFFPGCAQKTADYDAIGPYVELAAGFNIDFTRYGFIDGRLSVNPVQTVRWNIQAGIVGTYLPLQETNVAVNGPKYDLMRSWIDVNGNVVGTPELISEYAVDLKFAFTADKGNYTTTPPVPALVSYAFGDATSGTLAGDTTLAAPATIGIAGAIAPHRLRSVKFRIGTRSQVPDRTQDLRLPNNPYTIRYCINLNGCTNGKTQWARVRSLTTEVSLPNLARNFN